MLLAYQLGLLFLRVRDSHTDYWTSSRKLSLCREPKQLSLQPWATHFSGIYVKIGPDPHDALLFIVYEVLVSVVRLLFRGSPMASPTLVPRFGGQSYRKLITTYPSFGV